MPIAPSGLQHQFFVPVAANANGSNSHDHIVGGALWDPSPPYSPRYDSPTNTDHPFANPGLPYYNQPNASLPRHASNTPYLISDSFHQTSDGSDSAGSSTLCLPQWAHIAHDFYGNLNSSSDSDSSCATTMVECYGAVQPVLTEQIILPSTYGSSQLMTAVDRDLTEQDELDIPQALRHDSVVDLSSHESTCGDEERYLGAYFLWVHPLYPVIHRASFSLYHASPLLKAAMLALGAHALGDVQDKTNARTIHERCIKVLKKRTLNDWHTFRLCDMQAVLLIEIFALFKSRRPPLQFSKPFEDVYNYLANDHEALNPLPNDVVTNGATDLPSGFEDDILQIIGMLSKQRLLAACYILDSQHATLFGRLRTTCHAGAGMTLPVPGPLVSWDGQRQHQLRLGPHDRVWQALDGVTITEPAQQPPFDVFQSMLMIACLTDAANEGDQYHGSAPNNDTAPATGAMQQSAQIKLAYNTFMMCKHTPIRHLLAVAGESWVMAEKLPSQTDYEASQIEARKWASEACYVPDISTAAYGDNSPLSTQPAVQKAVKHALRIIELHMNHPKTGLLFQEWSVYLAAVVIWAHAYVSSNSKSVLRPRLSVPEPSLSNVSAQKIEQTVTALVATAGQVVADQEEARRVLLWAKAAIEKVDLPHNCGLTNGALDVLGKLVSRGSEEGWFGS